MPDNVLWYIVFSFPFFFPGYSVIESTVACVLGLLSWATGEVLSAANQIYGNKEAGVYILFNGNPVVRYTVQGLLCFIQIKLDNKNKIRYICLLS